MSGINRAITPSGKYPLDLEEYMAVSALRVQYADFQGQKKES